MASCPKCGGSLGDQDFGLIVCSQCGASVFIDMDGEVSSDSESSAATSPEPHSQEVSQKELETPDGFDFNTQIREGISNPASDISEADRMLAEGGSTGSGYLHWNSDEESEPEENAPSAEPEYNPVPEMDPEDKTELLQDSSDEIAHPYDGDYEYSFDSEAAASESSVEDIASFANATNSAVPPLSYRIELSGIDSIEIRRELKNALTDRRFLWDVERLMRSIEGGQLVIDSVAPVKAYVLVARIISLPIEIKWEQNAVANS